MVEKMVALLAGVKDLQRVGFLAVETDCNSAVEKEKKLAS